MNFRTFNANRAEGFWAKRATIVRADVIAMKAAADTMEVGHRQSKIIYQQHFENEERDEAVEIGEEGSVDRNDGAERPESSHPNAQSRRGQEHLDLQPDLRHEDGNDPKLGDEIQDDLFNSEELSNLLANIAQAQHPVCEWKSEEDTCISCLFQEYQRDCVQALQNNKLRKTDIADAMAILGVFAPFLQTDRMRAVFKTRTLSQLVVSSALPDPDVDDAAVLKAVRLRINNKREDASDALRSMDRKLRLMFDNLLESLPEEVDRSLSEVTFTVNYVAPVLNSILKISGKTEVHYPNTESLVQKNQGLKPDRPDILVKAQGQEILYGEITGPCRANSLSKTNWDLFRLVRFGKAFLDKGNGTVPLLQVVHDSGFMMRLSLRLRGMYILERIGLFSVPCSIATVPALLATLPVLLAAKEDVEKLSESNFDVNRKRSWRFDDIVDARKRIK
ncbi:hypothetical protein BGZ51_004942 [Haplosporangium sp. Z 767]|nr:hypothetical protein BGZ51_004942 [Haplosporangium sp. Z 767]